MKHSAKQLTWFLMVGDIRECLRNGMSLGGVRKCLLDRFANLNNDITVKEFETVLLNEHDRCHGTMS